MRNQRSKFFTGLILTLLTGFTVMANTKKLQQEIVKDGKVKSIIVLGEKPTRSAQLAAKELQDHVNVISGANIPIIKENESIPKDKYPIYVGEGKFTRKHGLISDKFASQESLIKATPEYAILIGRDDPDFGPISYEKNGAWPGIRKWGITPFYRLGTLYAVYNLLEDAFGVRWYMVTDLGRVAPKKKTLALKLGETKNRPWTIFRNSTRNHWQIPGEMPVKKPMTSASERDNNLFMFRTRIGGEPYRSVHSVTDYWKRFGEKHPDWFVDKPGPHVQLKYDNPEVIKQVVKDANNFFKKPFSVRRFGTPVNASERESRGNFFAVVPPDNRNFGDNPQPPLQPERRHKGLYGNGVFSNYIFTWVNNVAKQVAKTYPDYYISTIAYAGMFEPPEFSIEPNVAVQVCMADGWKGFGLENLKKWRERVSRLYTWEYYIDSQTAFPLIRQHDIANYIAELEKMNIDGMFIEPPAFYGGTVYKNPALYHLNHYITFRGLREKNMNIEAVLDEYYKLFYGPAEKPMKEFWTLMEKLPKIQEDLKEKGAYYKWASPEFEKTLKGLENALDQARNLATKEPYASRIALVKETALGSLIKRYEKYLPIAKAPVLTLDVRKVDEGPAMDGDLNDEVWKKAATTTPFVRMNGDKTFVKTRAKVIRDDKNLYIGFICDEPLMDKIKVNTNEPSPSISTDDSVEVFIGGYDMKDSGYLQIIMNADGKLWYHWPGKFARLQRLTNLGIEGSTKKTKDGWFAEFAIPLKSISAQNKKKGFALGLGLYRNCTTVKEKVQDISSESITGWSPTYMWWFGESSRFGKIIFE